MTSQPLDLDSLMAPDMQGGPPLCQIQVNAQGELSHQGAPIIHPGIRELIFESVRLEDGVYLLRMHGKSCRLEVEDTFYVVRAAAQKGPALEVTLNDGTSEGLDPKSLWIAPGDVIYCRVKHGGFPARFSRQAYYQLASWIDQGPDGGYRLILDGAPHLLSQGEKP